MRLVHRGIRPTTKLHSEGHISKPYGPHKFRQYELLPDGSKKYWDKKTLNSGCTKIFSDIVKLDGLIYCPTCEQYFSANQFGEIGK